MEKLNRKEEGIERRKKRNRKKKGEKKGEERIQ